MRLHPYDGKPKMFSIFNSLSQWLVGGDEQQKKMKFVFLSKSRISFFFLSFQILTMFIEEKEKEREEYSFVSKQPEKMISLLRFLLIIHSVCVCVFISERKKN